MNMLVVLAVLLVLCVVAMLAWAPRRQSYSASATAETLYDPQRIIWQQYETYGAIMVCRSGTTIEEMEQCLRAELDRFLRRLPSELVTYGEPVIEQFDHVPGKTFDGKITIKLQRRTEVA